MRDCIDKMANFIKKVVSKEKRRYEEDGYNLDLTYITGRIIAMGFPAQHIEAIYRNSLEDVKKMLEQKHRDHYKLYNLCSERSYDVAKFQNRVAYYPFDDHNPPEFSMMKTFCEDVEKWLAKNEENIAVVHCKAGKGRTGLMICAYLLHCKHNKMTNSEEVLRFYASKRTHNDQGVTIPSQRRYVDYYAAMLQDRLQYSPVKLYLHSFVIDPVPNLGLNQADSFIQFEVRQKHIRLYESQVYQVKKTDSPITIKLPEALL
jgi:phosphatidylinositol-3,4,5-trisphosphate 3-phosphatase/dual-specificity protein phosphatase PTEN